MPFNESALYAIAAKFHLDSALLLVGERKYSAAAKLIFLGTGFSQIIGDRTSVNTHMLNLIQLGRLPRRIAKKIPQEIRNPESYAKQFIQDIEHRPDLSFLLNGDSEKIYRAVSIHYNMQTRRTKLPRI